jgi:hypothetical protein
MRITIKYCPDEILVWIDANKFFGVLSGFSRTPLLKISKYRAWLGAGWRRWRSLVDFFWRWTSLRV